MEKKIKLPLRDCMCMYVCTYSSTIRIWLEKFTKKKWVYNDLQNNMSALVLSM